ncbi:MAG: hypothetical protein JSR85_00805 [Proteobacteria bacterium]|nr:hypothetical protein [Pseudomonadota bacterium]
MVTRYFIQINLLMFTLFACASHLYAMHESPSDKESDDFTSSVYNKLNPDPEDPDEEDDAFAFCGRLKRPVEDLVSEQQRLLSALIPPEFEEDDNNEGD